MSENKKTVTKGEKKGSFGEKVGSFFKKVGAWFKKTGIAIANFAKKVGLAIADYAKKAWAWVKAIPWGAPVKPVIAWSVVGGVLLLSVALMLIFWVAVV